MGLDRAIVIGASFAGIMAARTLSDVFGEVLVIERDDLPAGPEVRKGVPQGPHVHGILKLGRDILDQEFPGFVAETQREGALVFDQIYRGAMWTAHGWSARGRSNVTGYGVRRPLLEHVARRRLSQVTNLRTEHARISGFLTTAGRVAGVVLEDGEPLDADLVVDASGRASAATQWLERAGFAAPDATLVNGFVGYASRLVRVPDDVWPGDMWFIAQLPMPHNTKGAILYPQDNGVHIVSLFGHSRDFPPDDDAGFDDFLGQCITPLIQQVVSQSEPVSEIRTSRSTANRWHHYERLAEHPVGFIAIGDAAVSLNPIFGQGISSACLAAVQLRAALRELDGDLAQLAATFPRRLAGLLTFPWQVAIGFDLLFPATVGERGDPSPEAIEMGRHMNVLGQIGTTDTTVVEEMLLATQLFDPARLRTPALMAKVKDWIAAGRRPENIDPTKPPALRDTTTTAVIDS